MSGSQQNVAYMFIGGAIVVAIGATWGIFELLDSYEADEAEVEEQVSMVSVVAASRSLYQGVSITNDDLFVMKVPPEFLPLIEDEAAGTPQRAEVFASRERVVGRVPRERILANEYIRPERLADGNAGVGLNAVVPPGMRAMSLDLKGSDAVTGFLEPGNYVDVVVTMKNETTGDLYTETLLQTVMVLGVNSRAENESEADVARRGKQRPSVTFLLTQGQAEELAFANEMGRVSLSLRNVLDSAYAELDGVALDELLNRIKPTLDGGVHRIATRAAAPVAVVTDSGPTVTVIRGATAETVRLIDSSAEPTQPVVHR